MDFQSFGTRLRGALQKTGGLNRSQPWRFFLISTVFLLSLFNAFDYNFNILYFVLIVNPVNAQDGFLFYLYQATRSHLEALDPESDQ